MSTKVKSIKRKTFIEKHNNMKQDENRSIIIFEWSTQL